jgi:hypothetical protein
MIVLRENLLSALAHAISERAEYELQNGYKSDSALLAGWKQLRKALAAGERVEVT